MVKNIFNIIFIFTAVKNHTSTKKYPNILEVPLSAALKVPEPWTLSNIATLATEL